MLQLLQKSGQRLHHIKTSPQPTPSLKLSKKSPSHQARCWWVGKEVTNDSGKPARTDHLHVFPLKWEPGVTVTRVLKAAKPGLHGVGCPKARMERAGCVWPASLEPAMVLILQGSHPSAALRRSGPSWPQVLRTCPAPAQRQTAQPAGLGPPHQRPPSSVSTTLKNQSAPSLVTPMWSAGYGHPHFSPSPYHAFTPSLQPGFCPPTNQDIPLPKEMSSSPQAAPSHPVTTSCWLFIQNSARG